MIELFRPGHTNFYLVFGSRVSNYFPVVYSLREANVAHDRPENVGLFFEENVTITLANNNSSSEF